MIPATRAALAVDALELAPLLLGAELTHHGEGGAVTVRLTEVEAYRGEADPGSHAFRGRTPRNAVMFGEAGHLYAYFTYGMHVCINVVCGVEGVASAVLLRAGEVVEGLETARMRRSSARTDRDLARGPARLASALGVPLAANRADLLAAPFALRLPDAPVSHLAGPRVGVSGAGGGVRYPWRFRVPDDPTVSAYRRHPKSHD
ncbi:DNA-3-methyladenine glycosylase [Agromyces mangrovi Wang et al. 2018]|uniref:DNA-3-methyladenine glycosylase n=1 Tax=Agromyces mangrovi TaxID=1858653 RepID=UPI00257250EA|nr:DNA-3-methyladenine glycosylase [Agromyces mangrovi]